MKLDNRYLLAIKGEDDFVCICDSDFRVVGKCLKRGHGSHEWTAPLVTGQRADVKGKTGAYILERGESRLFAVNLDSLTDTPVKIEDFSNGQLYGINYVYRTGVGKYIGSRLGESAELFTYDAVRGIVQPVQIAAMAPSAFSANKFELSQTSATYSDAQEKLAVAYFSFPVIHILNDNGEDPVTLQLEKDMPEYTSMNASSPHVYLVDICSTEDYIYILYDNPEDSRKMNILAIGWNGAPAARYDVPRLTCFTVDEVNKRFIGLAEDDTAGVGFEFSYK
ncbi:MAG: hypothetical protein ACI350_04605 [Prevotella sp.]